MLAPGWEQGCKSCSFMADHTDGMTVHLAHRDATMAAISRPPIAEIERFRRRMGWQFRWVSSYGTDFNYDFGVSFTPEERAKGKIDYNFGDWRLVGEEWPGVSVFAKDDAGNVFHTYSGWRRMRDHTLQHAAAAGAARVGQQLRPNVGMRGQKAVDQALDPFGIRAVPMTKAIQRAFRAGKRFEIENCGHHILAPHRLPHPESNYTRIRQRAATLPESALACPGVSLKLHQPVGELVEAP
jgi:hypothetical protein